MEEPAGAKKPKIRKPVKITSWFGVETMTKESDSDNKTEWEAVDRRKKCEERRRRSRIKMKQKMMECATKAGHMAGLGPIPVMDV